MYTAELEIKAPGAVTENGQGVGQEVTLFDEGLLLIDITDVNGLSPTLDLSVETQINGDWAELPNATISQQTAIGQVVTALANFGRNIRISWIVGGTTPSFTFSSRFLGKGHR